MSTKHKVTAALGALLFATSLAACTAPTQETTAPAEDPTTPATTTAAEPTSSDELLVVTHDSFAIPDELKEAFAAESGYDVTYVTPGDGGALVNQLILTKDSPLGDVVFGIDNTYSERATSAGVISPYDSPALPEASRQFATEGLTPIDFGDVCINADLEWFEEADLPLPTTLDDLADPRYADLLVVTNPAASSPGLAFLVATIGAKGADGYLDYWGALADNGMKVVQGWSEAYYTEFSGADGEGDYPLVLSYATSPAFTLTEDGQDTTTVALLGTCFRQIEYAGVISGAQNEVGAQAFIDFLLSAEVQASIPDHMYMYPVDGSVELPQDWASFAPLSDHPIDVPAADISANRDQWIRDWTERVIG